MKFEKFDVVKKHFNVTRCKLFLTYRAYVAMFLRHFCEPGTDNKEMFNPFAPGDFAEKRVLKLVEWFPGGCRSIKS